MELFRRSVPAEYIISLKDARNILTGILVLNMKLDQPDDVAYLVSLPDGQARANGVFVLRGY